MKLDSCQTRENKIDGLTPDSRAHTTARQMQIPLERATGAAITQFAFLATKVATVKNSFHIFHTAQMTQSRSQG
jgi:hypothetical protein